MLYCLRRDAYDGKRIEWMRLHGVSNKAYYYWHKILRNKGMLDGSSEGLECIPLPPEVDTGSENAVRQEFVEYAPVRSGNSGLLQAPLQTSEPQIMIQKGSYYIYIGDRFNGQVLSRVLEVVKHAE